MKLAYICTALTLLVSLVQGTSHIFPRYEECPTTNDPNKPVLSNGAPGRKVGAVINMKGPANIGVNDVSFTAHTDHALGADLTIEVDITESLQRALIYRTGKADDNRYFQLQFQHRRGDYYNTTKNTWLYTINPGNDTRYMKTCQHVFEAGTNFDVMKAFVVEVVHALPKDSHDHGHQA